MTIRFRAAVGGFGVTLAALLTVLAPVSPHAPASADVPPAGQLELGYQGQVLMMSGPFSGVRVMIYVDQWSGSVAVTRTVVPRQRDLVIANRSGHVVGAVLRCPGKQPVNEIIRNGVVARLGTCQPRLGSGSLQS